MNRRGHMICLAQGLCLFCVNFMCFLTASQWVTTGLIAVVFSTATLWNALNARIFFKQKIARNVIAGGALGMFGLGLLFWPELSGHAATPHIALGLGLALIHGEGVSGENAMKTMNTQRGMTLTSFLAVLIVIAFGLYIGMKLFPMYQEYYAVRSALKGLAKEPGVGNT